MAARTRSLMPLLSLVLPRAVAAKRHPTAISSMEEFWWFIGVVYALLILPVLFYFLYALAKDPAARDVVPLMSQWVKSKMCGFLSPQRNPATRQRPAAPGSASAGHASARAKHL